MIGMFPLILGVLNNRDQSTPYQKARLRTVRIITGEHPKVHEFRGRAPYVPFVPGVPASLRAAICALHPVTRANSEFEKGVGLGV